MTAIIGLQWGDEGKGKIVDVLSEDADLVARCQGGANAGHTVWLDGRKFVLHLVPSGILREGAVCLIGNGVAVDLELLEGELRYLEGAGVRTAGRLVVSRRAHLVLPHHKRLDLAEETERAAGRIGTTMRGIGPCYADKYRRSGIRVGDIADPSTLHTRIAAAARSHAGDEGGFDADEIRAHCAKYLPLVKEIVGDVAAILLDGLAGGKRIVLEGAQGFLLDIDHGTYPYVTSSNTGVHGLATGSGLPPAAIDRVIGVLKAYVTRVGEGPFPTEMEEPYQTLVREKGGEYGATTGRPRKCGWLDLPALEYACALNGVTSLAITKLDALSGVDTLKVCETYEHSGLALRSFPAETAYLAGCTCRYTALEPWAGLAGVTRVEGLPPQARNYLDVVERRAGARAAVVSVGPSRSEVVRVQD